MSHRVDLCTFDSVRDKTPRQRSTSARALLHALTTRTDRADVTQDLDRALRALDQAHDAYLAGDPPPRGSWRWWADEFAKGRTAADLAPRVRSYVKGALPCWSPTRYRPGTTRGASNVVHVSAIVLDYDDGRTHPRDAMAAWDPHPRAWHTTWSHTEATPKYRLVVPLAAPVPAERWGRVWHWATQRAAGSPDRACSDASRLYLRPATPGASAPWGAGTASLDADPLAVPAKLPPTDEEVAAERRAKQLERWKREARRRQRDGWNAEREARARLARDPATRERAGIMLGGTVRGDRVVGVPCPGCGRASLWWPLQPARVRSAMCNHRNSCPVGTVPIAELLAGRAA